VKITFTQAEQWFSENIWYWANRLKNRTWDAEDLYMEVLIKIVEQDWEPQATYSIAIKKVIAVDPAHVLTFIRSRMIDLVRREKRSPKAELPEVIRDRSQPDVDFRAVILDLMPEVEPADLRILIEIATPSGDTLAIAIREQEQAQQDAKETGALRMNVNGAPKITQAHVAQSLGVTPSRVALAVRRAGRLLAV
jgi:hypothetical protein